MTLTISIIIPTYQRPALLRRALSSIGESPPIAPDVIVIDDDPDMSAATIVSEFAGVRYVAKRGADRGLSKSRNMGLKLAYGDYIIFLDDDDFFLPQALNHYQRAVRPDKSFYYADYKTAFSDNERVTSLSQLTKERLLVKNIIPVGAYMFQKKSIKVFFNELMKSHEDWEFILSNLAWDESAHINQPVVYIDKTSEGDASMQSRRKAHFWMEYIGIYSKFPAPLLAEQRKAALAQLGIDLPKEILANEEGH
jgi:glycosyltransferase involved in cell wall biosynthesis